MVWYGQFQTKMNNLFKPRKLNLKSVMSLFPDSMITKVKNLDFDSFIRKSDFLSIEERFGSYRSIH